MTFQNAPFVHYEGQTSSYKAESSLGNESIYAVIVEIDQIAGITLRQGVPIIALCDYGSQENWVSQGCVDYLSKNNKRYSITRNRIKPRSNSDTSCVKIRWSCGKLGQDSEEGTFFVEPKARFKLLFGCGFRVQVQIPRSLSSSSTRRVSSSRLSTDTRISDQAATSFREGIKDKSLLPLKRVPASFSAMGKRNLTLAELEQELHYIFTTHSEIDDALDPYNSSSHDSASQATSEVPQTQLDSPHFGTFPSSEDSYTSSNYEYTTTSTNTSVSEHAYTTISPQPFSRLQLEGNLSYYPSTNVPCSRWLSQPLQDEPQPWNYEPPEQSSSLFITRCQALDSTTQSLLDQAKKKAEKDASEYWIWDATVGNYKHFDDGSNEPIWYNPP